MSLKHRLALTVTLVLSSTSLAFAQAEWGNGGQDGNLGNRIPVLNEPGVYGYGAIGGARMLLPKRPTEDQAAQAGAVAGTLRSAAVSLSQRPAGTTLRSAAVSLTEQQDSVVRAAVAAVYPETGGANIGTLRGLGFSARTGIFREEVVAAALARLYGGGARSTAVGYQTAQVGAYGAAPIGAYRTAQVGLYRPGVARRMDRRMYRRGY